MQLAVGAHEVLRVAAMPAISDRIEQIAVAVEEEARAVVDVALPILRGRGLEERFLIDQRAVPDAATNHARG